MPCYSIQYNSIEFKAKHISLLIEAAKRLGYRPQHSGNLLYIDNTIRIFLDEQKAEVRKDSQSKLNELKREYSKVGLEQISKKRKFILKMKEGQKFELRRY